MWEKLDLDCKVELFELFEGAVFVSEEAALPIRAEQLLLKCSALLGLVLRVDRSCFSHQFLVTVGELALAAVATVAHLNPVLAHLRLVFGLVCL